MSKPSGVRAMCTQVHGRVARSLKPLNVVQVQGLRRPGQEAIHIRLVAHRQEIVHVPERHRAAIRAQEAHARIRLGGGKAVPLQGTQAVLRPRGGRLTQPRERLDAEPTGIG